MKARRAEGEVHGDDRDEHHARDERVAQLRLRGAPSVAVELPARALPELLLDAALQAPKRKVIWNDARALGVFLWLKSPTLLVRASRVQWLPN